MKVLTFLFLSLFSFASYAVDATHGMVLFGQEKLMAYHLPMFHKVHAFQVIFEYEVPAELKQKLVDAGQGTYLTFVPAPFDLEKFIANPHPIKGDVYSGHFEKDGVLIFSDVTLENPKMIYQAAIIKPKPRGTGIEDYKLIGTAIDAYAVHLLNGGQKMDQIFKLKIAPEQIEMAKKAIEGNLLVSSYSHELFKEGDQQTIVIQDKLDPRCYPIARRSCDLSQKELEVNFQTLYFTDLVM